MEQQVSAWKTLILLSLSGIACLCCDARRQVRMQALTYLQRALLVHDLQKLDALEWESCFNKVGLLLVLRGSSNHKTGRAIQPKELLPSTAIRGSLLVYVSPPGSAFQGRCPVDCAKVTLGVYLPGAVSSADQAVRKYQPCRCGWDGGDPDEGFHAAIKGTAHHPAVPVPAFPTEKPGLLIGLRDDV